jgi:hypothetical protein
VQEWPPLGEEFQQEAGRRERERIRTQTQYFALETKQLWIQTHESDQKNNSLQQREWKVTNKTAKW